MAPSRFWSRTTLPTRVTDEAAAPDQADKPAAGEVDGMARHVEMEPSPPADPRLKAVEVRHRDDDPAVAAKRLDRAAQPQLGVVEMLEHVPEDDDVGTLGRRAERLDRRVPNLQPRVALCRVRLDPDDAVQSCSASRRRSRPSPDPISITRAPGASGPSARRTAACPSRRSGSSSRSTATGGEA